MQEQALLEAIGTAFYKRRELLELSQVDVANACSVSPTTVRSVERAERSTSMFTYVKMACALKLYLADIIGQFESAHDDYDTPFEIDGSDEEDDVERKVHYENVL